MLRGENQVHPPGEPDFLKPFKGNTYMPAFVQTLFSNGNLGEEKTYASQTGC